MTTIGRRFAQIALMTASATALAVSAAPAMAQAQSRTFDIPAQSLSAAILEFSRQSDVMVIVAPELTAGKRSQAVKGAIPVNVAIGQLLRGSGLRAVPNSAGGYRIEAAGGGQAASPRTSGRVSSLAGERASTSDDDELSKNEIVVTGSNIRGANPTSSVQSFTRKDLEQSGYANTQDFVRSLPQNFKGGDTEVGLSEDGILVGGVNNVENGSSANLRGLGAGATLILLNGHRVSPSGFGTSVDISQFPIQAIDRIDVLTDGASAIYGADAVAGVINIVLRSDFNGAETGVRADTVTDGGRQTYRVDQSFGRSWNGGNLLATLQYKSDERLPSSERAFTRDIPQPTDLFPSSREISGTLNGHQEVASDLTLKADGLFSHRTGARNYTTNSFFGMQFQDIHSKTDFFSADLGATWRPFGDWRVNADGLYSQVDTRVRQIFDPELIGYTNGDPYLRQKHRMLEGRVGADGSLTALPAGSVKLAVGGGYRSEKFNSTFVYNGIDRRFDAKVASAYAELFVPLFSEANAEVLFRQLSLSAALRYDHYDTFGGTWNPKLGLLWSPLASLAIRATYSRSFQAPNAYQQIGSQEDPILAIYPGLSLPQGGTGNVLLVQSPGLLTAQKSRNLNFSAEFTPAFAPGLRLSATYYDIDFRNQISRAPLELDELVRPDVYGSLVTRFNSDAELQTYIDGFLAQGYSLLDFSGGTGDVSGLRYAIPFLFINAARTRTRGFDLMAEYVTELGGGRLQISGTATFIDRIETAYCTGCTAIDVKNRVGQPVSFRSRGQLVWSRSDFDVSGAVNYQDSYSDTTTLPAGTVSSYTTFDLSARYRPAAVPGLTLALSAINLFDRQPPLVRGRADQIRYDPANASPLGRVVGVEIRKTW